MLALAFFCSVFGLNWETVAARGPDSDDTYSVSSMGTCSIGEKLLGDLHQSQALF